DAETLRGLISEIKSGSLSARDQLIDHYSPVAQRIAKAVSRRYPSYCPVDDLVSAALISLVSVLELIRTGEKAVEDKIEGCVVQAVYRGVYKELNDSPTVHAPS